MNTRDFTFIITTVEGGRYERTANAGDRAHAMAEIATQLANSGVTPVSIVYSYRKSA